MKNTFILLAFALLALGSCNKVDPVCPDSQSYDFKLLLKKSNDTTSTRILIYNPDADTLNVEEKFPELVSIPLDLNANITTVYIDFINDTVPDLKVTDTINIAYTDSLYLNSQECGFIVAFKFDTTFSSISRHNIDTVFFINDMINEDNEGNIKIHY